MVLRTSDVVTRLVVIEIATNVSIVLELFSSDSLEFHTEFIGQLYQCLRSICWEILILYLTKGLSRRKLQYCQLLLVLNILNLSIHGVTFVWINSYCGQTLAINILFYAFWIAYEIQFVFKVSKSLDNSKKRKTITRIVESEDIDNSLTATEVKEFYTGIPVIISSDDQRVRPENIPFDKNLEICLPQLSITNPESYNTNGYYGTGYRGMLRCHRPRGKVEVCIKKNKGHLGKEAFKRFLLELKTMMLIGYHENVLELIGAWTKNISEGKLYIITEYCENKSLHEYLCLIRKPNSSPSGGYEDPEGSMKEEMFRWAYEVASGMCYIEDKGIVHGSLNTKTVLLNSSRTVRITEFGIAPYLPQFRTIEEWSKVSLKDIKESTAWRNLSWEALANGNFNVSSDVWSYAMTMWEVFTFAEIPYTDFEDFTAAFLISVKNGTRPRLPNFVLDDRRNILESCWLLNPEKRPHFKQILTSMYNLTCPKRRKISFPF